MHSREIEEQIKVLDGKRRGAVAESIRHTVEATDALTRATLLVAYSQLRTAEEIETLGVAIHSVLEEGISILQKELSAFKSVLRQSNVLPYTEELEVPENSTGLQETAFKRNSFADGDELPNLGPERVSIPK